MSKELEEKIIGLIDDYIVEDLRVKVEIDGLHEIADAITELADVIDKKDISGEIAVDSTIIEKPSCDDHYLLEDQYQYNGEPYAHPISALAIALMKVADNLETKETKNNGQKK